MSNEVIRALKEQNADKGGVPKSVHVIKDENGETYEVTQLGEVFLPTGQYVDMIGDNCRWTLKDDDIVVITYPKTGTHWVNNMVNYMFFKGSLDDALPMQPWTLEFYLNDTYKALKNGHVHSSHMKPHLLPPNTFQKGRKLILVVRNPKDTVVSLYHHLKKDRICGPEPKISWSCFLDHWIKSGIFFFNYFEFYSEWLRCIENNKDADILVVHFEELKANCFQQLRKIQDYLGLNNTDERLQEIIQKCSIDTIRIDMDKVAALKDEKGNSFIFRKGVVGDWKNYFTVAQNERMDALISEKFKKTAFNFDRMTGYS